MRVDHFAGGVFTRTAAVSDRKARLHLIQTGGTAIHAFADLSITDPIAEADVHIGSLRV